jgi:hypothetical protein
LVGSALRVQDPVLGHARPIQAQRCGRLHVIERPWLRAVRLRHPGEDLDAVLEIGVRELLCYGGHVDALTLADGDPGVEDDDAQLGPAREVTRVVRLRDETQYSSAYPEGA